MAPSTAGGGGGGNGKKRKAKNAAGAVAAASSPTATPLQLQQQQQQQSPKKKTYIYSRHYHDKVIVIGAGMAGLSCARELQSRGYSVLVVEARSRVGGRLKGGTVRTVADGGGGAVRRQQQQQHEEEEQQYVDLGGALIHGIDNNPLTDLVREMGVPIQSVQECLLLETTGWPVDPKEDERTSTLFNDCLEASFVRCRDGESSQAKDDGGGNGNGTNGNSKGDNGTAAKSRNRSAKQKSVHPTAVSFGDVFDKVLEEKSVTATPLLKWHQANLETFCGAPFAKLGQKWNEDEPYGYDGDHTALRHTWKVVVDSLKENLDILYDAPVKRVHVVRPGKKALAAEAAAKRAAADAAAKKKKKKLLLAAAAKIKRAQQPSAKTAATSVDASVTAAVSGRQSRRLRGEDADSKRRSSRSNKGRMVTERYAPSAENDTTEVDSSATSMGRKRRTTPATDGDDAAGGDENAAASAAAGPRKTVVQVTLENGTVLEANHVVCTLPLGVLKLDAQQDYAGVVFDPPLPFPKRRAIDNLGAGLLNKCVLSFPRVFWQDSEFLGLADDPHSYLVLNAHAYNGRPILIFMYGGSMSFEVEDWTDSEIVDDCLDVLKRICGRTIPDPVDYRVTRWGHEEYSRMAFTYVPPGVDGFSELRAMSTPIFDHTGEKPTLMFAGEHTTPFHPSTIHGAFLSGIREAYRLDLTLDPKANNYLKFSDNELYQRTFPVQRLFYGADSLPVRAPADAEDGDTKPPAETVAALAASAAPSSSTRPQHRRRRAATVMKLRRRQDKSKSNAKLPTANGVAEIATSPSRKSPRAYIPSSKMSAIGAVGAAAPVDGEDSGSTGAGPRDSAAASLQGPERTALENEMLIRSMESYGRDYEYLKWAVMPIHGGSRAGDDVDGGATVAEIRKRCSQLQLEIRNRRAMSSLAWKRWVARAAYGPKVEFPALAARRHQEAAPTTSAAVASLSKDADGTKPVATRKADNVHKKRKSTTKVTFRQPAGYVEAPMVPVAVAKTRSGRTVYKPPPAIEGVTMEGLGSPSSNKRRRTVVTKTKFGRLVRKPV